MKLSNFFYKGLRLGKKLIYGKENIFGHPTDRCENYQYFYKTFKVAWIDGFYLYIKNPKVDYNKVARRLNLLIKTFDIDSIKFKLRGESMYVVYKKPNKSEVWSDFNEIAIDIRTKTVYKVENNGILSRLS